MATLYRCDGTTTQVEPAHGAPRFSLDELYELLDAVCIDLLEGADSQLLVIDDTGKLTGKPRNESATEIFRGQLAANDYIAGDALLAREGEV